VRKLMWFTIGFVASCALAMGLLFQTWLLIVAVVALFAGIGLCFVRNKPCNVAAAILVGLFAGMVWMFVYNHNYLQPARLYDGKSVRTTIEISDYSFDTKYGIAADGRMLLENKTYHVRAYLDDITSLSPGDTLNGEFKLRFTAKGGEQEATYHPGKGILLLVYENNDVSVERTSSVPGRYFAAKLRKNILRLMDQMFPEDTLGFARALLLGDSSKLSYETDTAFKVSGIRHIIAVSGLHVSILFALVYSLCTKHRVITAVVGLPVLLLFAAVAGFTPSVSRACIMQALMILALLLNKEYDPPTSLAFAVLVILCFNPWAITSVSLQLSTGCVAGIFLFSGKIREYFLRLLRCPKGMSYRARFTRWFAGSVSITLSALVMTTPLCAWYFGMVSVVGVIANLAVLWVVSFIFYGIMFACIFGALWLPLGTLVATLISWLMRYVMFIADILSRIPMAAVYTCSSYILIWLVASYILLSVFFLMKKKRPVLFASCVLGCLCIALALAWIEPRMDTYRVTVLDVGQGQSVLLQAGDRHYLVDCGGDKGQMAADTAAEHLLSQGITKLDGVIVTHYDTDHADGIPHLLTRVDADKLYLPEIRDEGTAKEILTERYSDKICWIREDTVLSGNWGKLSLYVGSKRTDDNESGLCILFQPESCDILITGDRNNVGERELLTKTELPQLELLIVGHHGAKSSTGFELLSATQPKTAVISVGADNAYGHPSKEVLDRLELFGCQILRTDQSGTIIYKG